MTFQSSDLDIDMIWNKISVAGHLGFEVNPALLSLVWETYEDLKSRSSD